MINFNSTTVFITLFVIQFLLIMVLFQSRFDKTYQHQVASKIENLELKNDELKKIVFELANKLDINYSSVIDNNRLSDSDFSNETAFLSEIQILTLIDKQIESALSEKLVVNSKDLQAISENSIQRGVTTQLPQVSPRQQYIDKDYDSVDDEYFKYSLIVVDEIINRAIAAGAFTTWDSEQLDEATQELDDKYRIYIMAKLSHAYNSQQIKGKFIKFELVNRSTEIR